LIRIGTGRDAADVAFATIFGTVQGSMPRIAIRAEHDEREGLVEPFRHDYAVSTDGTDAAWDDVAAQLAARSAITSVSAAPRSR